MTWSKLYLIRFLHQTTTVNLSPLRFPRCILFDFYIKPQLVVVLSPLPLSCILFDFYIKPQPFGIPLLNEISCILFDFYIKPQLWRTEHIRIPVVSYSISTSNHNCGLVDLEADNVVSYSISTSNHNSMYSPQIAAKVVSYSISTSNHNRHLSLFQMLEVVSYSISTSNHNAGCINKWFPGSYADISVNKMDIQTPTKCVWCDIFNLTYCKYTKKSLIVAA